MLGTTNCSREAQSLSIGINAWPGYEFLYLAQEKGYYEEEGLEVRLVEFDSLSDCRRSFERGQIDGMGCSLVEVIQARDQSRMEPQVVRVVDYSNGADVILAKEEITKGEELRGARIGVELASLGIYVLAQALTAYGISLVDVTLVSMNQATMEEAFRLGELDAVVTYPPSSISLLRDLPVNQVFSTKEIPGEVVDVIAIERQVVETKPHAVAKLLRAYEKALDYAQQDPEDAYRIMAARERISPEEFASALTDGIKLVEAVAQHQYLESGGRIEGLARRVFEVLNESGNLSKSQPLTGIATPRFYEQSLREND